MGRFYVVCFSSVGAGLVVVWIIASRASVGRLFTPPPWTPGGYGVGRGVLVLLSPWRGDPSA